VFVTFKITAGVASLIVVYNLARLNSSRRLSNRRFCYFRLLAHV